MMPRLLSKPVPSAVQLQIVAFEFRLRSRLRPTRRCVHGFTAGRTGNFFRRFRAPRYSPLFSDYTIPFRSRSPQLDSRGSEPHSELAPALQKWWDSSGFHNSGCFFIFRHAMRSYAPRGSFQGIFWFFGPIFAVLRVILRPLGFDTARVWRVADGQWRARPDGFPRFHFRSRTGSRA